MALSPVGAKHMSIYCNHDMEHDVAGAGKTQRRFHKILNTLVAFRIKDGGTFRGAFAPFRPKDETRLKLSRIQKHEIETQACRT
eukprot:CAMPEP_0184343990 /NCGR_PEP_ID=MMETSP1089-20130417/12501_1 /TAXON_ID=38269 ORGANISM="Gloeochaete wittrockiana, Strain SAG46.84" /NCGR_SAMPLE_ID=MMETSP1089 /ASSEMBLY_ACC=CAM_ASM_000445 /LENGTH=83 /DNA_ID=CAMNT_0026673583 /DNA_START=1025 /DNA_END=1276 /DNA_ORIENTATION=+